MEREWITYIEGDDHYGHEVRAYLQFLHLSVGAAVAQVFNERRQYPNRKRIDVGVWVHRKEDGAGADRHLVYVVTLTDDMELHVLNLNPAVAKSVFLGEA